MRGRSSPTDREGRGGSSRGDSPGSGSGTSPFFPMLMPDEPLRDRDFSLMARGGGPSSSSPTRRRGSTSDASPRKGSSPPSSNRKGSGTPRPAPPATAPLHQQDKQLSTSPPYLNSSALALTPPSLALPDLAASQLQRATQAAKAAEASLPRYPPSPTNALSQQQQQPDRLSPTRRVPAPPPAVLSSDAPPSPAAPGRHSHPAITPDGRQERPQASSLSTLPSMSADAVEGAEGQRGSVVSTDESSGPSSGKRSVDGVERGAGEDDKQGDE